MSGKEDVLLVLMPFGPLFKPSLALSLLKSALKPAGITAAIAYFNLSFGKIIGHSDYIETAESEAFRRSLFGEWIFSSALHEEEDPAEAYLNDVLSQIDSGNRHSISDQFRPRTKSFLRKARRLQTAANHFIEACLEEVIRRSPRIVGFSSSFHQHAASLALAKRIKRSSPRTAIIFGGANCDGVMGAETLRQFPFIDVVVSGEADLIFRDLIELILSGRKPIGMPGVFTADELPARFATRSFENTQMVTALDDLPYADYDDYFRQFEESGLAESSGRKPDLLFETSRGCWWGAKSHCTFCGLNASGMAYRSKSAKRAVAELIQLTDKHPGLAVEAVDNILDNTYFKDFVPALGSHSRKVEMFYEMKANVTKEQIRMLREAGIRFVQPGLESLNTDVLRLMRKGTTAIQNIQLLKWCKELGVKPHWNIIWGFPEESPESYARMAELIPVLVHLPPPLSGGPVQLQRFSPLFNQAEDFGLVNVRPNRAFPYVYRLAAEHAFNMAYHFDFEYRNKQDIKEYTRSLLKQIRAWKSVHETADLFFGETDEALHIWDFRPSAPERHVRLQGDQRVCYLECDRARSASALAACIGVSPSDIEKLLQPLIERGLMIYLDNLYLSLAIRLGDYEPKPEMIQELWAMMMGSQLQTAEVL
jgi:ribosomal peptide maturation radical SAM protein 1